MSTVLIRVKYIDDGYDMVKNNVLDNLIEENKVIEFKRSAGWVRIGIDPVRSAKREQAMIKTPER